MAVKKDFTTGDFVVYPSHGVGQVSAVEKQVVAGYELEVFVITFNCDRMTLRLPVAKAKASGLRSLVTKSEMTEVLQVLKKKGRISRTMWSRRAQEYETKINSGNPESLAEVVRDLYRRKGQPEQSYSERQLYQLAMKRLAREIAAVEAIDELNAVSKVENTLEAA